MKYQFNLSYPFDVPDQDPVRVGIPDWDYFCQRDQFQQIHHPDSSMRKVQDPNKINII